MPTASLRPIAGLVDEVDRAVLTYNALQTGFNNEGAASLYARIYVDEIQDITQSEIALLCLVISNKTMSCSSRVALIRPYHRVSTFDSRQVVPTFMLFHGARRGLNARKSWPETFEVTMEFFVLDRLHTAFPAAASKLPPDTGLVLGPLDLDLSPWTTRISPKSHQEEH